MSGPPGMRFTRSGNDCSKLLEAFTRLLVPAPTDRAGLGAQPFHELLPTLEGGLQMCTFLHATCVRYLSLHVQSAQRTWVMCVCAW